MGRINSDNMQEQTDKQVVCIARIVSQCNQGTGEDHGCWWFTPMNLIQLREDCPHKNDISKYLVQIVTKEVVTFVDEVSAYEGRIIKP